MASDSTKIILFYSGQHVQPITKNVTYVTFCSTVKVIDGFTFNHCSTLVDIQLNEGLEEMKSYAFRGCTALKSIKLPSTVSVIGEEVFKCCTSLESVKLPSTVKVLGVGVFSSCAKLVNVDLNEGLEKISTMAFDCRK
jgi:hypothetical protein